MLSVYASYAVTFDFAQSCMAGAEANSAHRLDLKQIDWGRIGAAFTGNACHVALIIQINAFEETGDGNIPTGLVDPGCVYRQNDHYFVCLNLEMRPEHRDRATPQNCSKA